MGQRGCTSVSRMCLPTKKSSIGCTAGRLMTGSMPRSKSKSYRGDSTNVPLMRAKQGSTAKRGSSLRRSVPDMYTLLNLGVTGSNSGPIVMAATRLDANTRLMSSMIWSPMSSAL